MSEIRLVALLVPISVISSEVREPKSRIEISGFRDEDHSVEKGSRRAEFHR
jgi:hypothetical protein